VAAGVLVLVIGVIIAVVVMSGPKGRCPRSPGWTTPPPSPSLKKGGS
jgi:hypothetical protein